MQDILQEYVVDLKAPKEAKICQGKMEEPQEITDLYVNPKVKMIPFCSYSLCAGDIVTGTNVGSPSGSSK